MESLLKNQVALITGASRGIGRAIALSLAEAGCNLCLVARQREGLKITADLCHEYGVKTLCLPADLRDPMMLQNIVESTVDELDGLNFLINNAGLARMASADLAQINDWMQMLDLNLRSCMILTRLALPHIKKAPRGGIVFISSLAGKMSFGGGAGYCASKHAIQGFAGAVYEDVREDNIKVSTICPGFVNTDMADQAGLIPEKMIQPEAIAQAVRFVLSFPDNGCPTEIVIRPQQSPYGKS